MPIKKKRRPTAREAAQYRANGQQVPMYVYVDASTGTVSDGLGGSSYACDTSAPSSGGGSYSGGSSYSSSDSSSDSGSSCGGGGE